MSVTMETEPPDADQPPIGEHFGEDLSRPVARHADRQISNSGGDNTFISLGELGEHNIRDVRFRDSAKKGFVTAYIRTREFSSENKSTIIISTVAIGSVLTAIAALKHRRR
jgi:hypothetical protein